MFVLLTQSSDSQLLGEMMFGSMPLKLAGNSVKIHYIRSQHQLILTKIFTSHSGSRSTLPSCSVAGDSNVTESCPLPVDNFTSSPPTDYTGSTTRIHSLSPG